VYLEIVLRVPRIIRGGISEVAAITHLAIARQTQEEGGPVRPGRAGHSRIAGRHIRVEHVARAIVAVEAAVENLDIIEPELHAVSSLDPCHLFLETEAPLAGIGVHMG